MRISRVIGAEVRTVGDLLDALSNTDPTTTIEWDLGEVYDDEGMAILPADVSAEVDASALTARIDLRAGR